MDHPLKTLVGNAKGLTMGSIFLYVFSRDDVKLLVGELNRKQLGRGDDANDGQLRDYSPVWIDLGKPTTSNPYFDPSGGMSLRLYDEGDFYESIAVGLVTERVALIKRQTTFLGDDGEIVDLTEISRFLIGLNSESEQELIDFIIPIIIEFYAENLLTGY